MDSLKLTYADLKGLVSKRLASAPTAVASRANLFSALNSFQVERGFRDSDVIGSDLRASYQRNLTAHVEALRAAGRSPAYISNRKSLLGTWRRDLLDADRVSAEGLHRDTPFQSALKELFSQGRTVKGSSKAAGVPLSTLKRWLKGATPNSRSRHLVVRLERHFALPNGTLTGLVAGGEASGVEKTLASPDPYRERLSEASKNPYAVKLPNPQLVSEWRALLAYKTSPAGSKGGRRIGPNGKRERLKKQAGSRWTATDQPVREKSERNWYAFVGDKYVATADVCWQYTSQYLGWLMLPKSKGGCGLPANEAMTLANFARDDLLEEYLDWRVARSAGQPNNGVDTLLKFVRSLCNERTGFLTQSFLLVQGVCTASTEDEWRDTCRNTFEFVVDYAYDIKDVLRRSRDVTTAIGPALRLPNPLEAIADAIARHAADRPVTGGKREAIWARDRLLLKLLSSNPLRDKNVRMLTFSLDGDAPGHLRRVDGGWRIVIPKLEFKNFRGAARDRDYDMPVRPEVWADIERYLKLYRPVLASERNPYVFVSSVKSDKPMQSLRRQFAKLMRTYLVGCRGVGPHAMRHILATSILKRNPNAWATAAKVLHDREETVRKHYAHLTGDDAAASMKSTMDGPFSRM
ncbi:MAG: hypothetical protein KIT35_16625 [Piscinibacter sp.]|uniref:hypothetical protein n=1 Tax=Piscinibacter sp. TaxID=1903157 RepID=UPI002583FE51|nr:hypothetical protein [Piscinibacter sp.]MCW5665459.1 hypothetical protein [Piscinibacter sp.]